MTLTDALRAALATPADLEPLRALCRRGANATEARQAELAMMIRVALCDRRCIGRDTSIARDILVSHGASVQDLDYLLCERFPSEPRSPGWLAAAIRLAAWADAMTRHPIIISAHESKYPGDMCVTVGWCCAVEYPDPAWVGFAVGTSIEEAFANLAVCSALRAQPASGELLRAVLGDLAERPGLVEQAILQCEHFARGNEDDAVNVYAWEKNCTDFDADDRRTNRIANAAKCRQTARLLRDLVTP